MEVFLLQVFLLLSCFMKSGSGDMSYCTYRDQRAVTQCAQPLYDLGAFKSDVASQTFTWEFFAQKSKDYFSKVCGAFHRFDQCVAPYKTYCMNEEPVRSQYHTAVTVLDFLCREGYKDMVANFDCFVVALTRQEMMKCQSDMISHMNHVPTEGIPEYQQEQEVCGVMDHYMRCIREPIEKDCGYIAWNIVQEVVKRPTALMMPQCHFNGGNTIFLTQNIFAALMILKIIYFLVF